jgi:hypothetical protein
VAGTRTMSSSRRPPSRPPASTQLKPKARNTKPAAAGAGKGRGQRGEGERGGLGT